MRLVLAVQCFFRVLFDAAFADRVRRLDQGAGEADVSVDAAGPAPAAAPPSPSRNEAISLLAALQREARFVDIVSESLEGYSDAQIGAAARDVLSDCGKVIKRLFAIRPVVDSPEGEPLDVPADYQPGRMRLTGNVSRPLPVQGTLQHGGWEATQCQLPSWTGDQTSALVIAPAEVEVA